MRHSLIALFTILLGFASASSATAQTGGSCGPILDLQCQPVCDQGLVVLQWIPEGDYEGFEIFRNGQPIGFIPGFENQFIDPVPGPGLYEYQVQPFCLFGPPPIPGLCDLDFCPPQPPVSFPFIRGDANSDGSVNLGDWIAVLDFLFGGGSAGCLDAQDVNDDGSVNLGDAVLGLTYQFTGGIVLPEPFLVCGIDPTLDPLGCDLPTSCPPLLPPALPLPLDFAPPIFNELEAFAVQLYDQDSGQALPLQWIEDPFLVDQVRNAIPLSGLSPENLTYDGTIRMQLRTGIGELFYVDLAEILPGQPGLVMFADGSGIATPVLQETIGFAYGDPTFSSNEERAKETTCGDETPDAECDWVEETLVPRTTGVWVWTEVKLIVYQDDKGKTWNQDYANAHAAMAGVEAFGINGKNSLVNKLRQLESECKRVKTLVFACHGSPGSIRIGPQGTPFGGPTRVGGHDGQTSAEDFGDAIAPYLATSPTIKLYSCSPAADGGTDATDGPGFMQDLADASGASVEGSDAAVTINGDQASTQGAVSTATPGGAAPVVTTPAPAGDLNPC